MIKAQIYAVSPCCFLYRLRRQNGVDVTRYAARAGGEEQRALLDKIRRTHDHGVATYARSCCHNHIAGEAAVLYAGVRYAPAKVKVPCCYAFLLPSFRAFRVADKVYFYVPYDVPLLSIAYAPLLLSVPSMRRFHPLFVY